MKTVSIHARVEPKLKVSVEHVLKQLGLSMTDAITMYFNQIILNDGIPFDVKIPNKETRQAMEDAENAVNRIKGLPFELTQDVSGEDLLNASNSSTDFWDNETDDEVWNNV